MGNPFEAVTDMQDKLVDDLCDSPIIAWHILSSIRRGPERRAPPRLCANAGGSMASRTPHV